GDGQAGSTSTDTRMRPGIRGGMAASSAAPACAGAGGGICTGDCPPGAGPGEGVRGVPPPHAEGAVSNARAQATAATFAAVRIADFRGCVLSVLSVLAVSIRHHPC